MPRTAQIAPLGPIAEAGAEDEASERPSEDEALELERPDTPLKKKTKQPFFIMPGSAFSRRWDFFIILLLLWTATVTPFEVAFLESDINAMVIGSPAFVLFAINRLVDLGFTIDMGINFVLGYLDLDTKELITDRGRIAKRYLSGWFAIDLISVLPFDMAGLAIDSSDISQLRVLRVIRLLRLIKLLRVLRSARIFARLETSLGWSYVTYTLLRHTGTALTIIHWFACLWRLVPSLNDEYPNWMSRAGFTQGSDFGPFDLYISSIEFSTMALVLTYGSVYPANTTETVVALFIIFVAGGTYAYIIGAICQAVSARDPGTSKYFQTMDLLNMYMEELKISREDRVRLRGFLQNCKEMQRQEFYQMVLLVLSPKMRGEMAMRQCGEWISKVDFFCCDDAEERERFTVAVACVLKRACFASGEMLFKSGEVASHLYIVAQGVVGCRGRILRTGNVLGQDMIMTSGRRMFNATALSFCDMQTLSREQLGEILSAGDFPRTNKVITLQALRMALRKHFRRLVTTIQAANMFNKDSPQQMEKEEIEAWKATMKQKAAVKKVKAKTQPTIVRSWSTPDLNELASVHVKGKKDIKALIRAKSLKNKPADLESVTVLLQNLLSDFGSLQTEVQELRDDINSDNFHVIKRRPEPGAVASHAKFRSAVSVDV